VAPIPSRRVRKARTLRFFSRWMQTYFSFTAARGTPLPVKFLI
jgi:hypothetical protein